VPDWFSNAILDGIERLYVLSLQGTPSADTIGHAHQVWTETLWHGKAWHEDRDRDRLEVGFARLAQGVDRWPAPAQLLEALPRADAQPQLPVRLSPEQRQANRQRLQALMEDLNLRHE